MAWTSSGWIIGGAAGLVLAALSSAAAEDFPMFDSNLVCKTPPSTGIGLDSGQASTIVMLCRAQERAAHDRVLQIWGTLDPSMQARCSAAAARTQSYRTLETCIGRPAHGGKFPSLHH